MRNILLIDCHRHLHSRAQRHSFAHPSPAYEVHPDGNVSFSQGPRLAAGSSAKKHPGRRELRARGGSQYLAADTSTAECTSLAMFIFCLKHNGYTRRGSDQESNRVQHRFTEIWLEYSTERPRGSDAIALSISAFSFSKHSEAWQCYQRCCRGL